MPVTIELKLEGVSPVGKALTDVALRVSDLTPLMRQIGAVMQRDVQTNFQQQSEPDGTPWTPTSAFTLSLRPGGGTNGKTLQDTGQLRQSIVAIPSRNSVTVGSKLVYAGVMQLGAVVRPRVADSLAIPLTRGARRAGSPRRFALKPGQPLRSQYAFVQQAVVPGRKFLGVGPRGAAAVEQAVFRYVNLALRTKGAS